MLITCRHHNQELNHHLKLVTQPSWLVISLSIWTLHTVGFGANSPLVVEQILCWLRSRYSIGCGAPLVVEQNTLLVLEKYFLLVLEQISQWLWSKYPVGRQANTWLAVEQTTVGFRTIAPLVVEQIPHWLWCKYSCGCEAKYTVVC